MQIREVKDSTEEQVQTLRSEFCAAQSSSGQQNSPPPSAKQDHSSEELLQPFSDLRAFQKKATFDFHYLNDRLSQMQRTADSREQALHSTISNIDLLYRDLRDQVKQLSSSLQSTAQEFAEALQQQNKVASADPRRSTI